MKSVGLWGKRKAVITGGKRFQILRSSWGCDGHLVVIHLSSSNHHCSRAASVSAASYIGSSWQSRTRVLIAMSRAKIMRDDSHDSACY